MTSNLFTALPSAGIPRRIAAIAYDLLLLVAITLAYGLLVWLVRSTAAGSFEGHYTTSSLTSAVIMAGWWLVLATYFNYCWKKRGQTLAMKAWRLRLQQPDGTLPTAGQRWLRALLAPLSLLSVIGLLWQLWDKNRNCLHDHITGTRVVLLPKGVN